MTTFQQSPNNRTWCLEIHKEMVLWDTASPMSPSLHLIPIFAHQNIIICLMLSSVLLSFINQIVFGCCTRMWWIPLYLKLTQPIFTQPNLVHLYGHRGNLLQRWMNQRGHLQTRSRTSSLRLGDLHLHRTDLPGSLDSAHTIGKAQTMVLLSESHDDCIIPAPGMQTTACLVICQSASKNCVLVYRYS